MTYLTGRATSDIIVQVNYTTVTDFSRTYLYRLVYFEKNVHDHFIGILNFHTRGRGHICMTTKI